MAFKSVNSLDADITFSLGKLDKKTGKTGPETVEGYYLGTRTVEGGKYGPSKLHFLQTGKGNVGVWGKSDMDKKLSAVTPGTMVRLSKNGTRETKFGTQQIFKVEIDEDNTIEVEVQESSASVAADEDDVDGNTAYSQEDSSYQEEVQAAPPQRSAASRQAEVQALLNRNKKSAK